MQDHLLTKVHCSMISRRAAEVDKEYIPWLSLLNWNLIETSGRHVVQVQFSTSAPPVIFTLKLRQTDTAKVVGITHQRVAIH